MRSSSMRLLARRMCTAWGPSSYTEFAQERLRPARDLLNRVPHISASHPDIIDAGCGEGGPSKLLLERFPSGKLLCLDLHVMLLPHARMNGGRGLTLFVFSPLVIVFDVHHILQLRC